MTELTKWHITGDWFDNCSCAVACPCTFAQAPDNGFCESVLFWHIQRGHYGDINLDGLSFVRVGRWEGDLWAGKAKGSAGIFIDERADERQAEVLPSDFRRPGRRISGYRRRAIRRRPAGSRRGARADHVRDRARPRRVGNRDRRQSEGLGQGSDRPDKFAGKISAADEPAWLRDRAWTARDLGQINDVFRRCVRLQVSVDDEFEQAHPVRLGGSMITCCRNSSHRKRLLTSNSRCRGNFGTRARCTVGAASCKCRANGQR